MKVGMYQATTLMWLMLVDHALLLMFLGSIALKVFLCQLIH